MARPTKRKGTDNVQYHKRIPADVKRLLDGLPARYRPAGWGKTFITLTTGTADRRLGAMTHARIASEVEEQFAALRAGPQTLSQKDAEALAGRLYRKLAGELENNPGDAALWQRAQGAIDDARAGRLGVGPLLIGDAAARRASMETLLGQVADHMLAAKGIVLAPDSRPDFLEALARAVDQAAKKLERNASGDYRPDPDAGRFPEWIRPSPGRSSAKDGLTLMTLFERWAKHPEQKNQARRTVSRYRSVFAAVDAFLGKPDAKQITAADVRRYVEARMTDPARPLGPRSAKSVHLAALSSVFGWAIGKNVLTGENPARAVRIKVSKRPTLRGKDASNDEARTFAEAALAIPAHSPARSREAALRWCPLLCLFTGARVNEITQLRREDLQTVEGVRALRLTPEAGDLKGGGFRYAPVHPRLIELGLLGFVENAPDGPLFYDPAQRRKKDAASPQYEQLGKAIARWARVHGLGDPLLKRPLHAIRHRFMTSARRAGVDEQYVEEIAGHARGTMNRRYGGYPLPILYRELCKIEAKIVEGR